MAGEQRKRLRRIARNMSKVRPKKITRNFYPQFTDISYVDEVNRR